MAEYIERERAIREFAVYFREDKKLVDECESLLCYLPTADVVEVRHGEWIFEFALDGYNFYKCSECGRQEALLEKESTAEYFPYCHCGAKMDGKGEGE